MENAVWLINALMAGTTVLTAAICLRLMGTRLWKAYPWFALYMLTTCIETGLLLSVEKMPLRIYRTIWIGFGVVNAFLETKVVLDIFGRWTFSYPGIGAFGRRLAVVLLLVAVAVATSTLPVGWPKEPWMQIIKYETIGIRGTNIGFSLFLLLTLGFFLKFGGPVAPNLRRHTWAMTSYVTANAASYFVATGRDVVTANKLLPAVEIAALVFWMFALTPAGEIQPVTTGNANEWDEAEELNRQMQKLADSITLSPQGLKRGR